MLLPLVSLRAKREPMSLHKCLCQCHDADNRVMPSPVSLAVSHACRRSISADAGAPSRLTPLIDLASDTSTAGGSVQARRLGRARWCAAVWCCAASVSMVLRAVAHFLMSFLLLESGWSAVLRKYRDIVDAINPYPQEVDHLKLESIGVRDTRVRLFAPPTSANTWTITLLCCCCC